MKISCQESLVPGKNFLERAQLIEDCGYEGIEIGGRTIKGREEEIREGFKKVKIKASTICGYQGCLLDADKKVRDKAIEEIKYLLNFAGEIKVVGLIFVPIFGPPVLNDLSPYANAIELERRLLIEILKELAELAKKAKVFLLLEPLNRYETHFVNRLEQAIEICEKVNHPNLKVMADFFHMNIEERSIPEALQKGGDHIQHIHLADSTRLLPGYGHTDFKGGFAMLKKVGFKNYMALECGFPPNSDRIKELKKCAKYLKEIIQNC